MEQFEVHFLGCGSALPTTRHYASSQVVLSREKLFMIDCGEGTQIQLRKSRLHFNRLNHIFISHLHGDHCFGLIGLISTFGLLGRTATLHIYAHKDLGPVLQAQLDYFCKEMEYKVSFHAIDTTKQDVIFEDRSLTIETIPLNHRIPCCGFLFTEKPKKKHLQRDILDFYNIPICEFNRIKEGEDYTMSDGTIIPNSRLTTPADPSRSYAYCSDTAYYPKIISQIQSVDLLYHETTFAMCDAVRASQTFHSTTQQAAQIAKEAQVKQLVIGHYSSRYDDEELLLKEAMEIFPNTLLSKENQVITIK